MARCCFAPSRRSILISSGRCNEATVMFGGIMIGIFPTLGVIREPHLSLPCVHWFKPGPARDRWAKLTRRLGFGFDFWGEGDAWFERAFPFLDERVFFRTRRETARILDPVFELKWVEPDWLAFRGLVYYPVTRTASGSLKTTACDSAWKDSAFRWPIWAAPATRNTVRSLVADPTLVAHDARPNAAALAARGITSVYQSKIRRNDQGGYGSFSAADSVANAQWGDLR